MRAELRRYWRLIQMLFKYGRLRHSPHDFSRIRVRTLEKLHDFIPQNKYQARFSLYNRNSLLTNNFVVKRIAGEAAFLKRSFFPSGGHLHNPQFNLSYVRIPKAASTSMAWAMLGAIYPALKDYTPNTTEINYLADVNLQTKIRERSSEMFFTVVRNPLARAVSVYRDFFENRSHHYVMKDYLFGILPNSLTFEDFVSRISLIPEMLQEPHLKPQHYFVDVYERKGHKVVVLKIDKPGEVESFLSIYGLKLPLLNVGGEPYDYRSYFSKSTFDKLTRLYSVDIHKFHFETEVNDLKNFLIRNEQQSGSPVGYPSIS